ncbi:hypothetical protein GGE65_007229 [Skermanella aerolata]
MDVIVFVFIIVYTGTHLTGAAGNRRLFTSLDPPRFHK